MKNIRVVLFGLVVMLMYGCVGEERNTWRQGAYNMKEYLWSKKDSDGTYMSIVNSDDYFGEIIFWNNGDEKDNEVTYTGNYMINAWAAEGIKASHKIKWYPRGDDEVVIWSENEDGSENTCIYRVEEREWRSDIWRTTVTTEEGTFKEEIIW